MRYHHHTTYDTIMQAIGVVFFGEAFFLFSSIPQTPPSHPKKVTFPIGLAFRERHP